MGVNDADGNFDRILRDFPLNYPVRKGQAWGLPTPEFDDVRLIYNDHSTKKADVLQMLHIPLEYLRDCKNFCNIK